MYPTLDPDENIACSAILAALYHYHQTTRRGAGKQAARTHGMHAIAVRATNVKS